MQKIKLDLPNYDIENSYANMIVAGVDEVGRGCIAGPVVAACVILDPNNIPNGINDSKKLSQKKREILYSEIIKNHQYSIGISTVEEIDEINILKATELAMKRAVESIKIKPKMIIVDGVVKLDIDVEYKCFIKGDSLSLSIASASIVAKTYRDRFMRDLDKLYPMYLWGKNVGYPTKEHIYSIEKYGITNYHRKSFKPISELKSELKNNLGAKE